MKIHQLVYKILSTAMIISAFLLATGLTLKTLRIEYGDKILETGVITLVATPYTTIATLTIVAIKRKDKSLLFLTITIFTILLTSLAIALYLKQH